MSDGFKKILIIFLVLLVAAGVPLFFIFNNKKLTENSNETNVNPEVSKIEKEVESAIDSSRLIGGLPASEEKVDPDSISNGNGFSVEYVSFPDFYKKINDNFTPNISSYKLPINIKTDVLNYYDISRKLNLDNYIDDLNNYGFAVMENNLSSNNFYDIYNELYKKQIPILITSDFLIYYYQYSLKKIFKDIEENIFYSNLWEINNFLYEEAKSRYENNLKNIGDVNDRVLEAQRLATAYFATSLELLKPASNQINTANDLSRKDLFTTFEVENYSFKLPDYLKVDVEKEVDLIRKAQSLEKSPVLLYERDYKSFVVPGEYFGNAKLNNFYLTTKWLSSNFPLYYKSNDCPDCYLDFDDWRISMTTSFFIAKDIFNSNALKNKWARIYKTLAFFKGLRGDLTYIHYRDALIDVFGQDYKIEDLFADNNPEAINNLYKIRSRVLSYDFLDIEGGFDKNDTKNRNKLGVKMLTDFYWPNDYVLEKLSYPNVTDYQGQIPPKSNITSCFSGNGKNVRCNGFSLDIIALLNERSLVGNEYYNENTKYNNYKEELSSLNNQISKFPSIWHYNSYWKTLSVIREYLQNNKNQMPIFTQNSNWKTKELHTAVGSWVNLQLPIDNLKVYQKYQGQSFVSGENNFFEYNYIEPNLSLINEQIANVEMIIEMFKALKITNELKTVGDSLNDFKNNLLIVKSIILKELNSESLSKEDFQAIFLLGLEFQLDQAGNKVFRISGINNKTVDYNIGKLKLMVLTSRDGDKKSFSIGPVFSYSETRN